MKAVSIFDKGKDPPLSLNSYFISLFFVENSEQRNVCGRKVSLMSNTKTVQNRLRTEYGMSKLRITKLRYTFK